MLPYPKGEVLDHCNVNEQERKGATSSGSWQGLIESFYLNLTFFSGVAHRLWGWWVRRGLRFCPKLRLSLGFRSRYHILLPLTSADSYNGRGSSEDRRYISPFSH
jgi:hypothetical protein